MKVLQYFCYYLYILHQIERTLGSTNCHGKYKRLHYPRSTRKSSKNELHDAEVCVTDDESLTKYKATLLGTSPTSVIVDENNPNIVIMKSITLQVDGCEEIKMDLAKHDIFER
ncbi:hypothetical protein KIN20_023280 [Parelaphostrongylus tenuis]|uniref:Uncharacterized protein n=1 Tax=Parelaphostrongylus tenuis TaxID=148309 RepID=A0AAD5QVR8_PARTN|nr:hypothetical protein KIN20_023280 [Parelaphostrongylus tenuis]